MKLFCIIYLSLSLLFVNPANTCHKSKQHKLQFNKDEFRSNLMFQLIHMDLWSPYKQSTMNDCHYFLTIVDDRSRSIWTYLLQDNTQVPETIEHYIIFIENRFGITIKNMRTNNGSEFLNHTCTNLFQSYGINHQHTCPYSP